MLKEKLKMMTIVSIIILLSSSMFAQWQQDNSYKFKINIPANWNKNSYMDGTDKVWDFMSPDENAAIQIRAFESASNFTTDLLVTAYEEGMLPKDAKREKLTNHISKQGIHGKQGIYSFDYNGTNVSMGVFFTIQKGIGYVISAMIPTSMLHRKSDQVKTITESFTLLGIKPNTGSLALVNQFKITKIQLCDRLDPNNKAINPKTVFGPKTAEIHAVINFNGHTRKDLSVSWIYTNWNRTITNDKFNFTDGEGGIGVVSISKPNNGWPVGDYKVKFEMDGKVIDTKVFKITEQKKSIGLGGLSGSTGSSNSVSGRYDLISRSDGNNAYNFLYMIFNNDGTLVEKHQPKDSAGYIGEHNGTWSAKGNVLEIKYDWGTYMYEIVGNTLKHTDKQGIVFTYKKK